MTSTLIAFTRSEHPKSSCTVNNNSAQSNYRCNSNHVLDPLLVCSFDWLRNRLIDPIWSSCRRTETGEGYSSICPSCKSATFSLLDQVNKTLSMRYDSSQIGFVSFAHNNAQTRKSPHTTVRRHGRQPVLQGRYLNHESLMGLAKFWLTNWLLDCFMRDPESGSYLHLTICLFDFTFHKF